MSKHTVQRTPVIEAKVKTSAAAAAAAAFVLSLLGQFVFGGETPEAVAAVVESAVTSLVTAGITFGGGWLARHTPRELVDVDVE
ncbi:hypothetical protein B1813_19075 [Saccharomonospora piscinae]|uniref:Holin n=1 Tax=Saccharomonospora piscinae TaxID=687388 RepID=A0A1V8ZZ34_SACPI|nr:hypothetical protein [Saccharomonospora piscinae]OQO89944.1 hypothetical protein B1813_19075 [Saccharomonospora piscinae]